MIHPPGSVAAAIPSPVRLAVLGWSTAIAAGAAEALVRLVLPDPPTAAELGLRFAIYVALTALVLGLRTGSNTVRWALTLLLGGLGMVSLVIEPVGWLVAGGAAVTFLRTADAPTLLVVALRALHIAAVLFSTLAMFRPSANLFFRPARPI